MSIQPNLNCIYIKNNFMIIVMCVSTIVASLEHLQKKLYFEISKTLYLKFKVVLLQNQNFKLNFKTIYIL